MFWEGGMAKRVRDVNLESRAARDKLKARGDPYYRVIAEGLHIGYRKGKTAAVWVMRTYVKEKHYLVEKFANADDSLDADGHDVLTWWQAVNRARTLLAEREAAKRQSPAPPPTVGDVLDSYLSHARGRQKSYRDTEITVERLIRPELGAIRVADLTADRIRRWHVKLASTAPRLRTRKGEEQQFSTAEANEDFKRRRKSTANRILTVLKAALNRAFREEMVDDDKAWRRVEAFGDANSVRVGFIDVIEAQRLIGVCQPDFRRLVEAALQTGCRYGELCRLKVGDFNPAVGTLVIRVSKTGQPRHIVLTDEGVEFFASIAEGRSGNDTMLVKSNGEAWAESHQSRPMAEACRRAKISPPIGFHALRHTWASLAVMNGVPLMVIAKNLGHVDTRMVERHYGHLAPSFVAEAIRAGAPRFGLTSTTRT